MRKDFSGSAVTPSEERFLAPIIPDLSDKPDVFMYKLEALGSEPLRQLNNIRTQYGLIPLDEVSLKDKNVRVEDYYGVNLGGQTAPQNMAGQTQTGGGGTLVGNKNNMDQDAINLAKAIRQAKTGNKPVAGKKQ